MLHLNALDLMCVALKKWYVSFDAQCSYMHWRMQKTKGEKNVKQQKQRQKYILLLEMVDFFW